MNDVALGSPSRVVCRRCGMEAGRACRLDDTTWHYCAERVADLRALLVAEAKPRIVTLAAGSVLIDGQPAGPVDKPTPMERHSYASRGGLAKARRPKP